MEFWYHNAIFYHIYPLGFCGAPLKNTDENIYNRLQHIDENIEHIKNLGCNSVYIGPLFESTTHGYDTKDFFQIDRRLGTNEDIKYLIENFHQNGIKVVFDAVFNHIGREFFAFRDLQINREKSEYVNWFVNLNFSANNVYNDGFSYEGWNEHLDIVKLNLKNNEVIGYLLTAVEFWIKEFDIDGLRLDCADLLDYNFLRELSTLCKSQKPDFWLMGEIIHGDYNKLITEGNLDSVTNYECYKGIYSSHNDYNYYEIAYSLNRLFGFYGLCQDKQLYNFLDNHDVNRIMSTLENQNHIYNCLTLLFTIPGIPSIYYGSEFGIEGKKENNSDTPLRPVFNLKNSNQFSIHIEMLAQLRRNNEEFRKGKYVQLYVSNRQFAFARIYFDKISIIILNNDETAAEIKFTIPHTITGAFVNVWNENEKVYVSNSTLTVTIDKTRSMILSMI